MIATGIIACKSIENPLSLPAERLIALPKAPKSALFSLSFQARAFKARQDEVFRHFSLPSIRARQFACGFRKELPGSIRLVSRL
jgi:hypothetical protein